MAGSWVVVVGGLHELLAVWAPGRGPVSQGDSVGPTSGASRIAGSLGASRSAQGAISGTQAPTQRIWLRSSFIGPLLTWGSSQSPGCSLEGGSGRSQRPAATPTPQLCPVAQGEGAGVGQKEGAADRSLARPQAPGLGWGPPCLCRAGLRAAPGHMGRPLTASPGQATWPACARWLAARPPGSEARRRRQPRSSAEAPPGQPPCRSGLTPPCHCECPLPAYREGA